MVSMRDGVYLGWCIFGMVSIRDYVHSGLCLFEIVLFRIVFIWMVCIQNCIHLGWCPFGMVSIWNGVHSGLCLSGSYPFGQLSGYRLRDQRKLFSVFYSLLKIFFVILLDDQMASFIF